MDLFERQMDILRRVRLHMTGHEIGARVAELLHVAHRLHDHQMRIDGKRRHFADRLEHGDANGEIRHKDAVHHVKMNVVSGGDRLNVTTEVRKIGR